MNARPLTGKIDVIGSKLLKSYEFICKELTKNDFNPVSRGWEWDKKGEAYLYFIFLGRKLSKNYEVKGPPSAMKEYADSFRKKHKKNLVRSGYVIGVERRKYLMPEQLLKSAITSEFIREKVYSIGMRLVK